MTRTKTATIKIILGCTILNCLPDLISASIMMPPNGTHPMLPQPKMDSPSYYNYSPHPQDPQSHMVGMHPGMPNGQSQLSPSGNPHKRRKHGGMSSMSSTEDDVESTGDDTEHMSNYYGKSPMSNQSAGWQEQPMDPGRLYAVFMQNGFF